MPQVASSVSSGRPYRKRMTPRSMAMPTSAGDQEGERDGDRQRVVEQPGAAGADDLLHDEGGVGAEHHHLAVRHVDDAHHAEGDGEADGGEQQHRAERQPVPEVLRHVPARPAALSMAAMAVGRGCAARLRGWSPGRRGQQRARVLVAAVADDGDGGELVGARLRLA